MRGFHRGNATISFKIYKLHFCPIIPTKISRHTPRVFLLSPPCRTQTSYNQTSTVCLRLTVASLTAYSRCRLRHEVLWTSREYALLTPQAATGLIQVVFFNISAFFCFEPGRNHYTLNFSRHQLRKLGNDIVFWHPPKLDIS